jgi:hypothetical protein
MRAKVACAMPKEDDTHWREVDAGFVTRGEAGEKSTGLEGLK